MSEIRFTVSSIEISKLLPRLNTWPWPLFAFKAEMNPETVSETKLKSLVGANDPKFIELALFAICVIIVGMTALADCRGPYVLNGRKMTTGRLKDE